MITPQEPFIPEYIFCADLSLRQPGFAVLTLATNRRIRVKDTYVINQKNKKGTHGELLGAIAEKMRRIAKTIPRGSKVTFVRERAFSRFATETQTLSKVVGIADYLLAKEFSRLFEVESKEWHELAPKTIRVIICGSGNANKDDVRRDLPDFVGVNTYKTNDESDAVAAGVAHLINTGLGRPLRSRAIDGRQKISKLPKASETAPKKPRKKGKE